MTTLRLVIGTADEDFDGLHTSEAGELVDSEHDTLVVPDTETAGVLLRPTSMALVRAIRDHEPGSIRELGRIVGRHPPEVHTQVYELVDNGLVNLEDDGRAKRPVVWYDRIEATLPVTEE